MAHSTYSQAVAQKESLEVILETRGYTLLEVLVVETSQGRGVIGLKVRNPIGDLCLVLPQGTVTVTSRKEVLAVKKTSSNINPVFVRKMLGLVGKGLQGLFFEQEGEGLLARQTDTGEVEIVPYTLVRDASLSPKTVFPVISSAEIKTQSYTSILTVRQAIRRLREARTQELRTALHQAQGKLEALKTSLHRFEAGFEASHQLLEAQGDALLDSLEVTEEASEAIVSAKEAEPAEIALQVEASNTAITDLLSQAEIVTDLEAQVHQLCFALDDGRVAMYLQALGEVKGSKVLDPTRWGLPSELSQVSLDDIEHGKYGDFEGSENLRRVTSSL